MFIEVTTTFVMYSVVTCMVRRSGDTYIDFSRRNV